MATINPKFYGKYLELAITLDDQQTFSNIMKNAKFNLTELQFILMNVKNLVSDENLAVEKAFRDGVAAGGNWSTLADNISNNHPNFSTDSLEIIYDRVVAGVISVYDKLRNYIRQIQIRHLEEFVRNLHLVNMSYPVIREMWDAYANDVDEAGEMEWIYKGLSEEDIDSTIMKFTRMEKSRPTERKRHFGDEIGFY